MIYVFDFDGVISNSINECYVTACLTYQGKSQLSEKDLSLNDKLVSKSTFDNFRYLVGPANEYNHFIKSLLDHQNNPILDVVEQFKLYHAAEHQNSMEFMDSFFALRMQLKTLFPQKWLQLNPLYTGIKDILVSCIKAYGDRCFIASTKDEDSICRILKYNGIDFKSENILGKNFNTDKHVLLSEIIQRTNEEPSKIHFIDDNHTHLSRVSPLGIQLYLASWGYCHPDSEPKAEQLNAKIIKLSDLNQLLELQ
jgi:phosphoglycolate phosphatase-like HAD superfamily hydrolase